MLAVCLHLIMQVFGVNVDNRVDSKCLNSWQTTMNDNGSLGPATRVRMSNALFGNPLAHALASLVEHVSRVALSQG